MTSSLTLKFVGIGACVEKQEQGDEQGASLIQCAVDPLACQDSNPNSVFVPYSDLLSLASNSSTSSSAPAAPTPATRCINASLSEIDGVRCHDPANLLTTMGIPHPHHAAQLCVNHPQACLQPQNATISTNTQKCSLMSSNNVQLPETLSKFQNWPTQYTKCQVINAEAETETATEQNGDICVWNAKECPDPNKYNTTLPYRHAKDCPCDKVQTGACIKVDNTDPEIICAISKQACAPGYDFVEMDNLQRNHKVDCRLCQRDSTPAAGPTPKDGVTTTLRPTLIMDNIQPQQPAEYPYQEPSNDKSGVGGTIAVLLVVIGALATLTFVAWRTWRGRHFQKRRRHEHDIRTVMQSMSTDFSNRPTHPYVNNGNGNGNRNRKNSNSGSSSSSASMEENLYKDIFKEDDEEEDAAVVAIIDDTDLDPDDAAISDRYEDEPSEFAQQDLVIDTQIRAQQRRRQNEEFHGIPNVQQQQQQSSTDWNDQMLQDNQVLI